MVLNTARIFVGLDDNFIDPRRSSLSLPRAEPRIAGVLPVIGAFRLDPRCGEAEYL